VKKYVPFGLEMREKHMVKDAHPMGIYLHIIKPGVLYTMALPLI